MRNLAVEATYLKVDDFSATFTFGGSSGRATGDGTSFSIAGVGILLDDSEVEMMSIGVQFRF